MTLDDDDDEYSDRLEIERAALPAERMNGLIVACASAW